MARAQTARSKPDEPEDESQEAPEAEDTEPETPTGKRVSKSEAARVAIAEGYGTPAEAVAFIKSRFGIEMGPQHFSAVKSQEKKKQGDSATSTRQGAASRKKRQSAEGHAAPSSRQHTSGDGDLLVAIENIKELVGQFGPDKVKRMVDLIG